jgi:dephospho-CoA kinase
MITVGITGGIGAGKSETASFVSALGISVLDTDAVARDLVAPGQPTLSEIVDAFGTEMLDHQGQLDRSALGRLVFRDALARKNLESILHPRIFEVWTHWVREQTVQGRSHAMVVIPLLYEKGYAQHFQAVIALACSERTQRQRLRERQWSDEMVNQRLSAQLPMADKLQRANYGVWNEGSRDVLHQQTRSVLKSVGWPSGD